MQILCRGTRRHEKVASLTQLHIRLLSGVSWGRTADRCHQPPSPLLYHIQYVNLLTSQRANTSKLCIILLSAYCSFDHAIPACPFLWNSNIAFMLLLHSHFITFSSKWCQQWASSREALSVRQGTHATQSQQWEEVCATCAITWHDKAGCCTHSALHLIPLVSPDEEAPAAKSLACTCVSISWWPHVCQSRAYCPTRPPSAKAFMKAALKVTSQAESGELREMNTTLSEQAALASKGIWSACPGETQVNHLFELGHKGFVSTC